MKSFECERKVGTGAYGAVYKCNLGGTQTAIKKNYINKRIDFFGGIREIDYASKGRNHPYIVQLMEVLPKDIKYKGHHMTPVKKYKDDTYMLAFELAFCNLESYIRGFGISEPLTVKYLIVHYLLGIEFLHAKGIYHRDLKPGNLLIVKGSDGGVVGKVADLGGAKLLSYSDDHTYGVGTILYQPPEWLAQQTQGMFTDVWAMGCIIYEMLMKCNPFDNRHAKFSIESIVDIVRNKLCLRSDQKTIDKWNSVPGPTWNQTAEIIGLCLNLDYKQRPSVKQILDLPAFDAYRQHITDVRKAIEYESPVTSVLTTVDTGYNIRTSTLSVILSNYLSLSTQPWFRIRILFTAIDIFDRYFAYLQKNNCNVDNLNDNIFILCVCLYIAINHHVVFAFDEPFCNLVSIFIPGAKGSNVVDTGKKIGEFIIAKVVFPGSIRRYTVLDAANEFCCLTNDQKIELLGYLVNAKDLNGKTAMVVAREWLLSRGKK